MNDADWRLISTGAAEDAVDGEGDSELVRALPFRPGGARNEAQRGAGPAQTVRADGTRSPTDPSVLQHEARVRDLEVVTFRTVLLRRDPRGRGKKAEGGPTPKKARGKGALSIGSAVRPSCLHGDVGRHRRGRSGGRSHSALRDEDSGPLNH